MAKHYNTKMKERFLKFRDWIDKKETQGVNINAQAKRYASSYDAFKLRYEDLVKEHQKKHSDETAMEAMRARAYEGGTRKQIQMYVDAVSKGMEDLRDTNPQLFEELNDKYGYDKFDIGAIIKEQHGGSGKYLNQQYRKGSAFGGNPGLLQMLYYDLINLGIEVNFTSPY